MLTMIVCVDKNNAIGNKGSLLTHNKEDMQYFKEVTEGKVVLMGNNTYHSLPMYPKGLPNRKNIVFTSDVKSAIDLEYNQSVDSCAGSGLSQLDQNLFFTSGVKNLFKDCIESEEEFWCIGGASIYEQCSEFVQEVHISVMRKSFEADTFINLDFLENFEFVAVTVLNDYTNVEVYKRKA